MRRRTRILGSAALITVLLITIWLAGQRVRLVPVLGFGLATTTSTEFTSLHATVDLPVASSGEQVFVALVTNSTRFIMELHPPCVQSEYKGGRVVSDNGPSWDGKGYAGTLSPEAVATLPFGVAKDAKRFRVTFGYSRVCGPLRRAISKGTSKLPLNWLPPGIYSLLLKHGFVDGLLHREYSSPWIPNEQSSAGPLPQLHSRREQSGGTQFVAEGSVAHYNSWAAEDAKAHQEFTSVVSSAMNFSVVVSNSCYLMRLEPAKESAVLYHEAGFDGKTLYFLSRMNLSSPQNGPGVRAGPNVATAWIYHHQQAVHSLFAHEMGPVWLMFASGDYLRSVTNGLMEPPVTLGLFENDDYFPSPFTIPAQWTLQPAFPFLPVAVACQDNGETKTAPPFQNAKRAPPFDAGFTNIIFRVTGSREFDGILVPASAVLDTYRVDTRGKPELRPYTRYLLTLKKWSRGIPPTCFRPKLPGPTKISDTRAAGNGGRGSMLADQWPAE